MLAQQCTILVFSNFLPIYYSFQKAYYAFFSPIILNFDRVKQPIIHILTMSVVHKVQITKTQVMNMQHHG